MGLLKRKQIEQESPPETVASTPARGPSTPAVLSPEQELLLSACRVGRDPAALVSVQRLVSGNLDWSYLVALAKRHAALPFLARGLKSVDGSALPLDTRAALDSFCGEQRKRNLLLTAELVRILGALRNRGIAALPFKGPVLGQTVYRDLGFRSFADLDFLIHESDIAACMDVLGELGYPESAALTNAQSESMWRKNGQRLLTRKDGLAVVEPHVRLAPSTLALRIDYPGIWYRAVTVDLCGMKALSLAPEDLLIMLCVHGSKDQWSQLSWICDVAETVHAFPALDWEAVLDRARSQHCLRILLLGLELAHRLCGANLPANVQAVISADLVVAELAACAEARIFAPGSLVPSIWKVSPFRVQMHDGLGDRLTYVARTIVTPGFHHAGMISLPRSLYFGYYPIKLVFDYVLLPIWRMRRALS